MKKIITLGLSLALFSCGTHEVTEPESLITPATTTEISTIADAAPVVISDASIEQIIVGNSTQVSFNNSTAEISIVYDETTPTIAMESDDGIITYFQKTTSEQATLSKMANLDLFLQGVWVAIAQMKNGIYFKLAVDTENRLELIVEQKESGVQIDIQIQGTPTAEQVKEAEKVFTQWVNGLSSSSIILSSSSSSSEDMPISSSSVGYPSSSSSSLLSSSSFIEIQSSSSSLPISSSSSSLAISSSSIASSSSVVVSSSSSLGSVCLFDEYQNFLIEMKSWYGNDVVYTKETCTKGTVLFTSSNKTKYIDITILGDSPFYNKIAIRGAPYLDTKTCSFTQSSTATSVWNYDNTFLNCLDTI